MYFFDGNKSIFYFHNIYNSDNDYINILQYENQVLSFYKNFKNFVLPDFAMTEPGLALKFNRNFY